MKILWFANTQCGAGEYLNNESFKGGWLQSLEGLIKNEKNVDLSVAFYLPTKLEPFQYKGVKYYPIYRKKESSFKRYIGRILNKIETDQNLEQFENIVMDSNPDLIHIHGTELPFGLLNESEKNTPIIISIQGNFTIYTHFFFKGISKSDLYKFSFYKDMLLFRGYAYEYRKMKKRSLLEGRILKRTNYILGRTHWDHALSKILAPNSKYYKSEEVLRNSFYLEKWPVSSFSNRRVFTICSNNLYKGVDVAFQTCIYLKSIGINNIQWRIAGVLVNDTIVKLCIKKFKVNPSNIGLKFLGSLDESKILTEMKCSSIYVQTSHIENSPNSLCEAMMLGMPIIASAVGGTMSLLAHDVDGILYQDDDSIALAGCIINFLNMKEDRINEFSKRSRAKALLRHNKENIKNELIGSYKTIISDFK